ncbi:TIGR03364 family FAD-dependent oxidoreductase [Asticcacaulis sp. SL142]|uniref:TIGR03364 family FAD-dependent oxidoreductase n=1 Tax=Asticcacaulis sp. SL142 TaxID=2995155 RepID=UPI00226CE2D5|nr:TIGR03364 family FAD-dependent oxidoreductase [Asticcacaulis sp. SL142]WAC49816.1 TIGR03364 family FAD-dependent oxidoreductase [Asticcacaulis sp. SL142]
MSYDVAIVGAGIVGLAHALIAVRRGLKVVVLERGAAPTGASIRNFGFITVTGQGAGDTWRRARRSRDIWAEIAPKSGIEVLQNGLLVTAQRPEALSVLEAFAAQDMGLECQVLSAAQVRSTFDFIGRDLCGGLFSPHELRVQSRHAIPALVSWLLAQGVEFHFETPVTEIAAPDICTPRAKVKAAVIIVCPGDDLNSLYPHVFDAHSVTRCQLHMLRLASPGRRLPVPVMSDLSMVRYKGYAELPESAALKQRLMQEQPDHLAAGVHLIVTQDADGSLIVGDSHHYGRAPEPFYDTQVEALILDAFCEALNIQPPPVIERWLGTYASAPNDMFMASPEPNVRLVVVTSGTGASTAFGIAEETFNDVLGTDD